VSTVVTPAGDTRPHETVDRGRPDRGRPDRYGSDVTIQRVLAGLGRSFISSGVLILLFVVYQLWGTGVRTGFAQNDLEAAFEARKAEIAITSPTISSLPASSSATTATPSTAPAVPPPQPGEAIGRIAIDKIGVKHAIVEGVDLGNLAKGPGHFPETPLPGQAGNAAIAGHRVTHGAPFNRIDELVAGDIISVETFQGTFTYEVIPEGGVGTDPSIGHRIITPYQTEILDQTPGSNTITLMACHPKYDLKQRIVVVGRLVQPPAPTTTQPATTAGASSTTGLPGEAATADAILVGGDESARVPAVLFGACAGLVWLAAWLIGQFFPSWRQWQRWTVFAAALPVFAVPLFLAFEAINDLLPAGY
jgi:sortase A